MMVAACNGVFELSRTVPIHSSPKPQDVNRTKMKIRLNWHSKEFAHPGRVFERFSRIDIKSFSLDVRAGQLRILCHSLNI
jgi:hypothetical protein